ncbi:hypothetical protein WD019_04605 [Fictibacillus sp. Mic-4]|uniref:hypothetical protein n=1 Tax=Fictibacillus sp. Mic-4 TaxID=3132826 RepID=UPI003CF9EB48
MDNKKINKLAIEAQKDVLALRAAGTSLHEENYTEAMWLLGFEFDEIIRNLQDRHGCHFNKTMDVDGSTAYERRLRKRLMECTITYDGKRDFEGLVRRAFERTTREFYKRRTGFAKNEDSVDRLAQGKNTEGRETQVVQFLVPDERANTERIAESRELVGMILEKFGTDEKRRYILARLADEMRLSVSDLAREIAGETIGTKFNSTRQFITRFIVDMREFIASYA